MIITSAARQHLLAHPEIEALLPEIEERMEGLTGPGVYQLAFPGRGLLSACVETAPITVAPTTVTTFTQRAGRTAWSRAIVAHPEPTDTVTVILGNSERFITAWAGPQAPKEPWDPTLRREDRSHSILFWAAHALCVASFDKLTRLSLRQAGWF